MAIATAEQKKTIGLLEAQAEYAEGNIFCVLDARWHARWQAYIGGDGPQVPPGPIDNEDILDNDKRHLRPGLIERSDFILVSERAWTKLQEWYGGGPTIARSVIRIGDETIVELAPPTISVTHDKSKRTALITLSKVALVRELKRRAADALGVAAADAAKLVLVAVFEANDLRVLDEVDTIDDARLSSGQTVRLQQQPTSSPKRAASPPNKATTSPASSSFVISGGTTRTTSGSHIGICGLSNMGNTCFMNSALQCLSATERLRVYFLSGRFKAEINRQNPIGARGQIAEQFGELMQHMWSGKAQFRPTEIKHTVGKFAPRFSGFQQHDAQEFLAFLLDGLHEDLNRVLCKPYVPAPSDDSAARPDAVVAREAWERHLKRNRSIIVDLFQAQLKSTVRCPDCQLVSVTFDPFMYLSLPLPSTRTLTFEIVVDLFDRIPLKYFLSVATNGTVLTLKNDLAALLNSPEARLPAAQTTLAGDIRIGEVAKNAISVFWGDARLVSELTRTKLFAFIAPQAAPGKPLRPVQIVQRVMTEAAPNMPSGWKTYGMPTLLFIASDETTLDVYAKLLSRFSRLIRNAADFSPAGPFPFSLSIVDARGLACAGCRSPACSGCPLPPSNQLFKSFEHLPTLALDWSAAAERNTVDDNKVRLAPNLRRGSGNDDDPEGRRALTLVQCLKNFCHSEQLGPQDSWYCPRCKAHRQAYKRMELFTCPEYFVIHLKRFAFSQSLRNKIDTLVEFPLEGLNLAPLLQNAPTGPVYYDLYAVSNHMGGLGGGHYTAFVKSAAGQWFRMNDSSCGMVKDVRELQTSNAYVLFYARRPELSVEATIEETEPPAAAAANGAGHANGAEEKKAASSEPTKRRRGEERKLE